MTQKTSTQHHLHWSSLIFDVIAQGRQILIPTVLALLGAARGNLFWIWIALLFYIPGIVISVFRYLTLTYSILDGKLVVSQGLLFRKVRTVPVDRIQNLDFVQNVLHRLFGVAELKVETAAGSEPEANLRVLSLAQIDKLRSEIFGVVGTEDFQMPAPYQGTLEYERISHPIEHGDVSMDDATQVVTEFTGPAKTQTVHRGKILTEQHLLSISMMDLVKAGIANNRGMVLVGIFLGLVFQSDLGKKIDFSRFQRLIPDDGDRGLWYVLGAVAVVIGLVMIRFLSVGWYVLRFFGYRLVRRGEDLRISCGLFTKVNATVPRQRIQLISVHQNLLMRWMGLCAVRIETAGGSVNSADASESVSGRWFVPVVSLDQLDRLMEQFRPGLRWNHPEEAFQRVSERAGRRRLRLAFFQAFVLGAIGMAVTRPWGWVTGLAALPILIIYTLADVKAMKYAQTSQGVVFRSGVLTRKTSITFFEKIQSIEWHQTPLDRRWKMARLLIDTAAAGSADHRIHIPMIEQSKAIAEQYRFTCLAASHQPDFR